MTQQRVGRPSDERRERLKQALSVPVVSNFFPIERYYDAATTAYDGFQEVCNDPKRLDEAYVYGKRYCLFCLDAIPKHNYYKLPKNKALRDKHNRQVNKVIVQLEEVAQQMDVQEIRLQKEREVQAKREAEERARREQLKYEELMQRAQMQQRIPSQSRPGESVADSAMSKLEKLKFDLSTTQEGTGRVNSAASSSLQRIRRDPSGEEPSTIRTSRYHLPSDDDEDDELLPPPLPPPCHNGLLPGATQPPAYDQVVSTQRNGRYRPGSLMNQSIGIVTTEIPAKRRERIPMAKLQEMYRNDYNRYQQAGSITVTPLGTYQGRNSSSTNGCTVISALVAAAHLTSRPAPVSDAEINGIIDIQCGPILRKIRGKLGLGGHALIIPSDVHDQLVDDKILHQEYFIGAAGGNVMDPNHMGEFLKLVVRGEDGKSEFSKSAATFFFREHVISIVKTPIGQGQCCFDLIDSLPTSGGLGSRTRCKDVNSLQVLMRWYTSRKFSSSDCSHIDRNEWNDAMADVDPRVFQGFVWAVK